MDDDVTLSDAATLALQQVMGLDMTALLHRVHEESSEDEEENSEEKVSHLEYYKQMYPERYQEEDLSLVTNPIAVVTLDDEYVQNLVERGLKRRVNWTVMNRIPDDGNYHFHWGEYENIDWFSDGISAESLLVSCYYNRKGFIRKGHLANILEKWHSKHPDEQRFQPKSYIITLDLTGIQSEEEIVDQLFKNIDFPGFQQGISDVWILKPSVTNQANGIALVGSKVQLISALIDADELQRAGDFVLQDYIPPLLVNGLKFHLRVFMLLVGNLVAYVHPDFLAISSLEQYEGASLDNTRAHLTNICHQEILSKDDEYKCMRLFDEYDVDMVHSGLVATIDQAHNKISQTKERVNSIIANTVAAVNGELTFQARQNCFEIFGLDFMIDPDWNVFILEANAEPDLGKAGDRLQYIIDDMLEETMNIVIDQSPRFADSSQDKKEKFINVFENQRFR